jgi:hypothetical protein
MCIFIFSNLKVCQAELVEAGAIRKRNFYYDKPAFDKLRLTLK